MKYEYYHLNTSGGGLFSNKTSGHREIINDYASKGWRYVGWFPTNSSNIIEGLIEEVDLIFEKDE